MASLASLPTCPGCGSDLAPRLLSCPTCHRLVHGARLQTLAQEAETALARGEAPVALARWREALDLLPPGTRQHSQVSETVTRLSSEVDAAPLAAPPPPHWLKRLGGPLALVALALWKFKFVVVFLLTKGKLLLLGLTKTSTLFSMLLSLGVYWAAWGWKFALGLVLSMYVHEMGHVFALERFGIKATAPMFIPGLGALVRLKQYPATAAEDARVGLAGPLWGLYAALASGLVFLLTGAPIWAAITRVGAWLNLFNLMPVWQLDGGRGFRALTRKQRWIAVAALGLCWAGTHESLLALLFFCAIARAVAGRGAEQPDHRALVEYIVLVGALSALTLVPVALPR